MAAGGDMRTMFLVLALVAGCKKKPAETPKPGLETGPIIEPVNFESGSTSIAPAEEADIDKAARIQEDGKWKVLLVGLADGSGDPQANLALSQARADAVKAELVERGVPEARITTHAVGERLSDEEDAVTERKVEFVFYHGGEDMNPHKIAVESGAMTADYHNRDKAKAK
jgi:outer membrane protein OmpA-like peptidoglycan-associated protein